MSTLLRWTTFVMFVCLSNVVWASVTLTVNSDPSGAAITGGVMAMGNVNGLGVGIPGANITIVSSGVTNGVLYTSPYDLKVTVTGGDKNTNIQITAVLTLNFTHSTLLKAESCQPGTCTAGGNFSVIPNAGNITVVPSTLISGGGPSLTQTFVPTIAAFVSNANGASAYSGVDAAVITFTATGLSTGNTSTATLGLALTLQNAVQLTLGTATGGVAITPAADYTVDFGSVNGLGVGTPSAGLTLNSVSGGVVYSTPYLIQPSFSDFTNTTSSLTVYVSTDFANPGTLVLKDASAGAGPFTSISKTPGSPTPIYSSVGSGSTITRYLGLFVSSANGAGAFPGSSGASGTDTATLTFTMTIP